MGYEKQTVPRRISDEHDSDAFSAASAPPSPKQRPDTRPVTARTLRISVWQPRVPKRETENRSSPRHPRGKQYRVALYWFDGLTYWDATGPLG